MSNATQTKGQTMTLSNETKTAREKFEAQIKAIGLPDCIAAQEIKKLGRVWAETTNVCIYGGYTVGMYAKRLASLKRNRAELCQRYSNVTAKEMAPAAYPWWLM